MIAKIVLFLALVLTPCAGWGAIALDGTPTGTTNSGSNTVSWSHTCTAGSATVVSVGNFNTGAFSSVDYNGVTFTSLFTGDNSGGASSKHGLYMAVSGCDGAAHNVTVTLTGTMDGYTAGAAASYSGVETASVAAAHRTVYNGGAGGGGGSVNVVDSQSGDYVVAGVANYKTGGVTMVAGGNARITQDNFHSSNMHHGLQDYAASGGNTSTSWTNTDFFTQSATALIPASGGGGATVRNLMLLGVG